MNDPLGQAGQLPRAGDPPTPLGGPARVANSPIRSGDPRARADADCELARAVAMCAADAAFLAGIEHILGQADRAAAKQRFDCRQCGNCCRFEQFGHRLYVTAGELALMLKLAGDLVPARSSLLGDPRQAGQCPYQDHDRCLARAGRSLGCRLFFCDPSANAWFCDAYEGFHRQIKLFHAAYGLPYVYVELTAALADLASAAG